MSTDTLTKPKAKPHAFEDVEKWWVVKTLKGAWRVLPPQSRLSRLELHGEFTRHDAAPAFAVKESGQ